MTDDEERQRRRRNMRDRARRNAKQGRHPRETLIRVSNEGLRERFLWLVATNQTTAYQVARNVGWLAGKSRSPDSRRVRRMLGVLPQTTKQGDRVLVTEIGYEIAETLCRGMHALPAEVGV